MVHSRTPTTINESTARLVTLTVRTRFPSNRPGPRLRLFLTVGRLSTLGLDGFSVTPAVTDPAADPALAGFGAFSGLAVFGFFPVIPCGRVGLSSAFARRASLVVSVDGSLGATGRAGAAVSPASNRCD
ncbi:hypothetical protein C3E77_02695 [Mycetocola zhujimingii]|nr:hypothetical protein C3E77_02695 [Mycetocola zhujimingii]